MHEDPPPTKPDSEQKAVFEIVDKSPKASKKQYAIMSIVCLALSGTLLAISLSQKATKAPAGSASDILVLKTQVEDLSKRIQQKRIEAGLEPSAPTEKSAQGIAQDARDNITALVEHSNTLQSLLDQKDAEITKKQKQIDELMTEVGLLETKLRRIQLDQ